MFEIVIGVYANTLVMPGLDPGIHPSSQEILSEKDGLPGQAPAMISRVGVRCACQRHRSEARIFAMVLADISRRTQRAVIIRGTVVKGEAAGHGAGSVIVQIADVVGQSIRMQMIMVMVVGPRLGHTGRQQRGQGQGGQEGGGERLVGHLDSPAQVLNADILGGPRFLSRPKCR